MAEGSGLRNRYTFQMSPSQVICPITHLRGSGPDRIRDHADADLRIVWCRFERLFVAATARIELSGKMRANFFLGANRLFRKAHVRGGPASGMLSRSNACALISN
jgi:hypothetical protein